MTPIGVKTRRIRNLYVLVVLAPRSRKRVLARFVSRRPWTHVAIGDIVKAARRRYRVVAIVRRVVRTGDMIEHRYEVSTRAIPRRRAKRVRRAFANVVPMPIAARSVVAEFLRYHVLVRVFDGDADAWLAQLRARGGDEGDIRFARLIRTRLRGDPSLLTTIRKMVDATPFWGGTGDSPAA